MTNNYSTANQYTFVQLLKEHQITIPVIQRDYVQGRDLKDVEELRSNFIKEIIEALNREDSILSLGFIYGKVLDKDYQERKLKSKEAIESMLDSLQQYAKHLDEELVFKIDWKNNNSKDSDVSLSKFIPLDGQQRLTTLFLLHWYIIHQLKIKDEYSFLLKGFKYQNRKETQDFINALINQNFEFSDGLFSEQVKTNTWFFNQWLNNPSALAMINTIDTIHNLLKNQDLDFLISKLNEKVVVFDFLDLVELKQTDEIYVKMNARGKQLSDFENFKAWLQGYIKNHPAEFETIEKDWETKIDVDWLDLFWENNKVDEVDNSLLKFFQIIGLSKYASKIETLYANDLYTKIKSKKFEERYLTFEENKELFSLEILNHIFDVLTFLSDKNINEYNRSAQRVLNDSSYNIKSSVLNGNKLESLSQNDEIILHGILWFGVYSKNNSITNDFEKFEQWLRIIKNLAKNTFIQGFSNYSDALKSLNNILPHCYFIEDRIKREDFNIDFFYGSQKREEKLKIQYFDKGTDWKNLIVKYENHPYFNGQIGFIFDILNEDEKDDIVVFEKIGDRLSYLFGEVLDNKYSTLQATLLSIGDYTIKKNSKWSFINKNHNELRSRFDNWRKVFDKTNKYDERIPFEFLKDLARNDEDLDKIRKQYSTKDWRNIFIKNKALIEYCSKNVFDYQSKANIQLLKGTTFTGKSVDALLYYIHKKLRKREIPNEIYEINGAKRIGNQSYVKIKSQNNCIAKLKLNFPNENIQFVLEIENISDLTNTIKDTIENLFTYNEYNNYELSFSESEYLENQDNIIEELVSNLEKCYNNS